MHYKQLSYVFSIEGIKYSRVSELAKPFFLCQNGIRNVLAFDFAKCLAQSEAEE